MNASRTKTAAWKLALLGLAAMPFIVVIGIPLAVLVSLCTAAFEMLCDTGSAIKRIWDAPDES